MKSSTRRTTTFRPSSAADLLSSSSSSAADSLSSLFSLLFHSCCCLASLLLGFRFSRLLFLLLFSSSSPNLNPTQTLTLTPTPLLPNLTSPTSHVVVGRHGILIRPNPHPNPSDTARAHRILRRVQSEQRSQYGAAAKSPRPLIAVTPTYSRTFQALHLTGLVHSLSLAPYPLTWIVVEAGGASNETADLLTRSKLNAIHLGFDREMPVKWSHRHRMEAEMRIRALREVRERKLDGIVVFTDDSNMHSLELFDEIQKVKWMGAVSVGILAHSGDSNPSAQNGKSKKDKEENLPVPVQGPACNSSDQLVGWHTFNSLPYLGKTATFVGDGGTVLPARMEWAGFVLNSRLVWTEAEGRPDWVRDFESVGANGEEVESPLVLVKDAAFVEPLGSCGRKVMLWWLRAEARSDSKFPSRWIIDPPLEITVPAKCTPWPEVPPELPKLNTDLDHTEKRSTKTGRSSRSRHSSRSKRKHESRVNEQVSGVSQSQAQ